MNKAENWQGKHFSCFTNRECEYFPCHAGADPEHFNCLFCFCPLYALDACPGNYVFLDNGIKDCSGCLFPHQKENYGILMDYMPKLYAQLKDRSGRICCSPSDSLS